ncbi:MAG TPA: 6,7-dimethyl-8-ribityllumazine synthase [Chloroflexota bacterium]|nr:6,7-dimethyl-8-ribityllumazine synthase [Chloroflexota bacterium]
MPEFRGMLRAEDRQFAIVVSRFNEFITDRLLAGARDAFRSHGVSDDCIDVAHVPGALEIPLVAQTMAASGRYSAVVCLGAVIRGATPHFGYVSGETASGIASAARATGVPIIFGVLTTDTIEQAIERAGTKSGNKGYDAAVDAIEMASLMDQLRRKP